ncbi:hypothetical protein GOODEAATRI_021261, partial [Goodea atripinnis]
GNAEHGGSEVCGVALNSGGINAGEIGLKTEAKKKAIWMDCGIHAREWIAPAFCQYFVRQTRLWRKNRSPGPSGDCYGTDLNRNFDANWGTVGVSSNCSSNIYCGRGPISEPEAQAITYFVGSRKEDFLCFFTIHSYGQLLLVPYGHPDFTASNYDELEIPLTFTFELRDNGTYGFKLPENQIQPTCEEAYSGALHIITYAHDKTFNGAAATAAATLWTMLLAVGASGANLM